jgi:hypothetical protein
MTKTISSKCVHLSDLPSKLRGLTQNRFGGHQTNRLRSYPGKFGPASDCRIFSEEEKRALERKMRKEGRL